MAQRLTMPESELCEVMVAMAEGRRIVCPGAVASETTNTYGVPVLITPNVENGRTRGFVVTLDTGVKTFLNPGWYDPETGRRSGH